jgi:hypothetical protein
MVLATPLLQAHDGHGQEGASHWHATDSWGFLMLGVAVAVAWWFNARK